jgi:hypothetical protein
MVAMRWPNRLQRNAERIENGQRRERSMRLKRIGDAAGRDEWSDSADYSSSSPYRGDLDDGQRVYNHFSNFGSGLQNTNLFRVSLEWSDVEAIIAAFVEMGHPKAARLERAKRLSTAVEQIAQNSN